MARSLAAYGVALAAAALALQGLEYQLWARGRPTEAYLALLAAGFLALGVWVGARLFQTQPEAGPSAPVAYAHNAPGLTAREVEVLTLIAAGRSNKEIARALAVSPNTIKTHVARVLEKLGAARRTEAVMKARALGVLG
ncbi:MAG: response regulator transcription factor [Hyphomonadaceae bacterium]|nr:response regulator transcription factor [Hyphomonadaceae bacterium]